MVRLKSIAGDCSRYIVLDWNCRVCSTRADLRNIREQLAHSGNVREDLSIVTDCMKKFLPICAIGKVCPALSKAQGTH